MKLFIDSIESDLRTTTFSEQGYGKSGGLKETPFQLEVDATDFLQRFSSLYDECITELRRDDQITGEFHPPFTDAEDYPTLHELLQLPVGDRMKFIGTYLVFDILRLYFAEDEKADIAKWMIWRCDLVERREKDLLIRGMLRPTGRAR